MSAAESNLQSVTTELRHKLWVALSNSGLSCQLSLAGPLGHQWELLLLRNELWHNVLGGSYD